MAMNEMGRIRTSAISLSIPPSTGTNTDLLRWRMAILKEHAPAADDLTPVADAEIAPAHRAWMNTQIEQALDHKRSGKATYKTLDETRRKFGF
jgi:hypothetical protein